MTDAVAHRGPDGEGHYVDGPIGFGHRRLAIIDLDEHSSGKANRRLLIWSLLSFEWWCRCFLDGSANNSAPADSLELAAR